MYCPCSYSILINFGSQVVLTDASSIVSSYTTIVSSRPLMDNFVHLQDAIDNR